MIAGTDETKANCEFETTFSCGYSGFSRTGVHWIRMGKNEGKLKSLTGLEPGIVQLLFSKD